MRSVEGEAAGRIVSVAFAIGICGGCHSAAPDLPGPTERQRTMVIAAVEALRTSLNEGSCRSIYDEAAGSFRRLQRLEDWMHDCERIRTKWGRWESFEASDWNTAMGEQVRVAGTGVFATGRFALRVGWNVNSKDGTARMWMFLLRGAGADVFLPPFPTGSPRYFDAPPRKHRAPA